MPEENKTMTENLHKEEISSSDNSSNSDNSTIEEQEIIEGEIEARSAATQSDSLPENSAEKLSGDSETVDTNVAVPRFIGMALIVIVFGFLMGWSFIAPLDSAAYAPGFVVVESYRKTIQHLEGGIVKEIKIKEAQLVNKGDLLIVLDDTQLKAQMEIFETQYVSELALLGRLKAERDNQQDIDFNDYLQHKRENNSIAEILQTQEQVFKSRKVAREGEIDVLNQRIDQLEEQINGLLELQKSDEKQIRLYSEEIIEFRDLLKKGFTDKTRMRDMQRRVAELQGEVARNSSDIVSSKIKKGETKLQIIQIENQHQLEVAELLSQAVTKINDLQERRLAIQDKLLRTKIIAQDSGMVLGLSVHTLGGVISPGKPILEIVPQGEDLIIEARVSPTDIDKVHTGLISEVRFSSFKSATTPIVEGEVISVSADSLVDQNTGAPYYLARIRVTPEGYKNLGELKLLPGMPADTLIKIGERTVFEYLMQPASNAFARSFIED
ncbi:MAG: HlyD family type I secretion periplasmic adaptor subunit [gamma proteobacterium symbiont of Taylorina sp.]|nr:HlyD family type I secretion periplasmic adaptor subunit [gamma proteobacterium symbiont of Taylorina sp.]